MKSYAMCLCIGRFQPFHWGHWDLLQTALSQGQQVLIFLGSHHPTRSLRNPWTAAEREQIIRQCLPPSQQLRVQFQPLPDYATHEEWAAAIAHNVYARAAHSQPIAMVSYHETGEPFFRRWFPTWTYIEKTRRPHLTATSIRQAYFSQQPESTYQHQIPPGTWQYLRTFKTQPAYQQLCQHQELHQRPPALRSRHSKNGFPHPANPVETLE